MAMESTSQGFGNWLDRMIRYSGTFTLLRPGCPLTWPIPTRCLWTTETRKLGWEGAARCSDVLTMVSRTTIAPLKTRSYPITREDVPYQSLAKVFLARQIVLERESLS